MSELHQQETESHPCIGDVALDAMASRSAGMLADGKLTQTQYEKVVARVAELRLGLAAMRTAAKNRGLSCPGTGLNEKGHFVCPFEGETTPMEESLKGMSGGDSQPGLSNQAGTSDLPALFAQASRPVANPSSEVQ